MSKHEEKNIERQKFNTIKRIAQCRYTCFNVEK